MESMLFKIVRICNSKLKFHYLRNRKLFLYFSFHFWNLHQILNILQKRMIVVANIFPKLETVKILVGPISKKCRFRTRFESQHLKPSKILVKSPWERFCLVFSSFPGNLISKMFHQVLGDVLVVFVNRLTADGKYPVQECENCQFPIQMIISEKQKPFF